MSQITPWTILSKGILAFSCTIETPFDSFKEISLDTLTCWNLRVDLVIAVVFLILFTYQLRIYYLYYEKQLFKTRQRIMFACIMTILLYILSYSVWNMIALYNIGLFLLQTVFCSLLYYFLNKISKLASGWIIRTMSAINFGIISAFAIYLVISLASSYDENTALCPGFLNKPFSIVKMVLLGLLVILYLFCGIILSRLLRQHRESVADEADFNKRGSEIFKLKGLVLTIAISELSQLAFIIFHYGYYANPSQDCPMNAFVEGNFGDNVGTFFFRVFTLYFPMATLLWIFWIKGSEVNIVFSERYSEERFHHTQRFASRLSYNVKRQTATRISFAGGNLATSGTLGQSAQTGTIRQSIALGHSGTLGLSGNLGQSLQQSHFQNIQLNTMTPEEEGS